VIQRRPAVLIASLAWLLAAAQLGCQAGPKPYKPTPDDAAMLGPVSMRIHPIFTRFQSWSGDVAPEGIEVLIEVQDQFGDPVKARGKVIFELYEFQKFDAQRKGERVCNQWVGSLLSVDDQRARWNRTSRTYAFRLTCDQMRFDRPYVLTAQFLLDGGGRFFDELVLEPPQGAYGSKRTYRPTTTPATVPSIEQPVTQPANPAEDVNGIPPASRP
jgi:hypothetical protein